MSSYEQLLTALLMNPPNPAESQPLSNRRATIFGTSLTFLVISWMAVTFRFWVRLRVIREPGWDDAFIFVAALCNTAATICVCLSVHHGLGRHMLYIGPTNVERYLLLFYIEHSLYVTESVVIKVSLLLQYLRIFKAGVMRWLCIILLSIVSLWGLGFSIVAWFPCFPVRGSWERHIDAKCYGFGLGDVQSFVAMFKAHSASNMTFDVVIFLTPMVLFGTTNLRLKNVLAMIGVFAFGAIVVATSVWRLCAIISTRAATQPYIDFTWWSPTVIILACLEIDLAIICASMPIFWPIIEKSLSAIFVSFEVEIVEEHIDDYGLAYELEHTEGRNGRIQSISGTSTQELSKEEEGGMVAKRDCNMGFDTLNEEPSVKTDIKSTPKPKWEL
ncbi:hypothetical protein BKA66DRAFT_556005 [Pyrenochaeta sp. MPI-SDFR-AT-0127]|nr:hypothetical protein BKA66DRAFT_556005 [Pyrenochaeta sp. MPI-SDFR-AT-0127]